MSNKIQRRPRVDRIIDNNGHILLNENNIERYRSLIKMIRAYKYRSEDLSDVESEAFLGIYQALNSDEVFNTEKEAISFIRRIIERRMIDYLRTSRAGREFIMGRPVDTSRIEEFAFRDENSDFYSSDFPHTELSVLLENLDDDCKTFIKFKIQGFSHREISEFTGMDVTLLRDIQIKLKNTLEELLGVEISLTSRNYPQNRKSPKRKKPVEEKNQLEIISVLLGDELPIAS